MRDDVTRRVAELVGQIALVAWYTFLEATTRAGAIRTLESLARIELGAQGGALLERVTTTRISKSGVATTRRVSCITRVSVSKLPKGPGPGRLSSC